MRRGYGCRSSPFVTTRRSATSSGAGARERATRCARRDRGRGARGRSAGRPRWSRRTRRRRPRWWSPPRATSARRAGCTRSSSAARAIPSFDSGSETGTHRSSPKYTSIPPQARSTCGERLVGEAGRVPARQRDRRRRHLGDQRRERVGDIVDVADLSVHGVMIRTWNARRCGCTSSARSEWRDRRRPRFLDQVRALASTVPPGGCSIDLGCGAGLHLASLPRPVVALDAAHAMVPPRPRRGARRLAGAGRPRGAAVPARRPGRGLGPRQLPPRAQRAAAGGAGRPPPDAGGGCGGAPGAARRGRERIPRRRRLPRPLVRGVDPGGARRCPRRCRLRGRRVRGRSTTSPSGWRRA